MDETEILKMANIKKDFEDGELVHIVLNELNLSIKQGEFVFIVGPSGSGKSTLLNLIGGLDTPTSGQILFDGEQIQNLSEKELIEIRATKIGYIFQSHNLISTLTVMENISILKKLNKDFTGFNDEEVYELVKKLDLEKHINSMPANLSGGQRQRVALLRGIIHQPKLLLADEPTGNLDRNSSKEVLNLLKEINRDYSQTLVVVTHDLDLLKYGDKALLLKNGKLVKYNKEEVLDD